MLQRNHNRQQDDNFSWGPESGKLKIIYKYGVVVVEEVEVL